MKRKDIPAIIGLINMLLKAHEPITIYINNKPLPKCKGCYTAYEEPFEELFDNYIVFELADSIKDMIIYQFECIHSISIENERISIL